MKNMKKLLLLLPFISSSPVKCIKDSDGKERLDFNADCSSGSYSCAEQFHCSYFGANKKCACPKSDPVNTAYGMGCKFSDVYYAGDSSQTTYGGECGWFRPCADPYGCYGGDQVFENGGQCWCDGDSCIDHASGACVPLGATAAITEASKKKYKMPYKGPTSTANSQKPTVKSVGTKK